MLRAASCCSLSALQDCAQYFVKLIFDVAELPLLVIIKCRFIAKPYMQRVRLLFSCFEQLQCRNRSNGRHLDGMTETRQLVCNEDIQSFTWTGACSVDVSRSMCTTKAQLQCVCIRLNDAERNCVACKDVQTWTSQKRIARRRRFKVYLFARGVYRP